MLTGATTDMLTGATTDMLTGATTDMLTGATTDMLTGATTDMLTGATTDMLTGATTDMHQLCWLLKCSSPQCKTAHLSHLYKIVTHILSSVFSFGYFCGVWVWKIPKKKTYYIKNMVKA